MSCGTLLEVLHEVLCEALHELVQKVLKGKADSMRADSWGPRRVLCASYDTLLLVLACLLWFTLVACGSVGTLFYVLCATPN